MTEVETLFAGIAVTDFPGSTAWYGQLLGRPPDIVVHDREVMWHLADAAWLYVVEDADRAGGALVTLLVADLNETVAEIAGRGISGAGIELVGDAGRKASFSDASGNTVSFIEVPGR